MFNPLINLYYFYRFSLLLLEPGEYYFEDYIASLAVAENNTWLNGRLKVCSLSLVFDPKDNHKPIIKIPFTQCGSITQRFYFYIQSIMFLFYFYK